MIKSNNILNNHKKEFKENGFVILKNVINKKTITNFSKSLAYLINASSVKGVKINNIGKKNPEILKEEILRNLLH